MTVVGSGRYVLGEQVEAFEAELAEWVGTAHCVCVASGTDALRVALMAHGVGPGDEVITTTHTSVATVSAIEQTGARPVLVDIEPTYRCIDPDRIESAISNRTRGVIAVHIYGQSAEMDKIARVCSAHGIPLVEDCAQAMGATDAGQKVGCLGDVGAFSFYPTKNLAALGDGGALVTDNAELAARARRLRQYGWKDRQVSVEPGINSRLDELQAAVLRVNLRHLNADNRRRHDIAAAYSRVLSDSSITPPTLRRGSEHAMHLYVVECDVRDELRAFLERQGIQTALHYPLAIHQQPAYRVQNGDSVFPVAARLYRRMSTLPLYPFMPKPAVSRVCAALQRWHEHEHERRTTRESK